MTTDPYIGEVSLREFYSAYWRKRPLLVKGGGSSLSAGGLDREQFLEIVEGLSMRDDPMVRRHDDGTIHAQNLDRVSERFRLAAAVQGQLWGTTSVWYDASLSPAGGTIGSHHDTSDNFIMQQQGSRRWNLQSPDHLDSNLVRARCVGLIPTAGLEMTEVETEVQLEPGDLLYIPALWIHQGITCAAESVSLTLALNLEPALLVLFKQIRVQLTAEEVWWRPRPLLPVGANDKVQAEIGIEEEIDAYLDRLLDVFTREDFRRRLKRVWRASFSPPRCRR